MRGELVEPIKNSLPMIALGTLFAIVFGTLVGVVAAWRRGTFADRGSLYTALGFYSMPTQWLGLMLIFFVAGAVGLPTSGIKTPTLGLFTEASTRDVFVDRLESLEKVAGLGEGGSRRRAEPGAGKGIGQSPGGEVQRQRHARLLDITLTRFR